MSGLTPGDQVDGWTVQRRLWVGTTGIAVHCRRGETARVLKVFHTELDDGWVRFQREAKLLGTLEHPGLVGCVASHLDADPPYLELDLTEGRTLRDRLDEGPLSLHQALTVARDLAKVLAYMHGRAVWHRDLRPDGILFRDPGAAVVEFGAIKEAGMALLTRPGTRLGDAVYAPPEWLQPDQRAPATWDIYSLGVVLCECLLARPLYEISASDPMARVVELTKIKRGSPFLDPGSAVPEPVRQLVRDLTSRAPADRPGAARAIAHRVGELLRDPTLSTGAALQPVAVDTAWNPVRPEPAPAPELPEDMVDESYAAAEEPTEEAPRPEELADTVIAAPPPLPEPRPLPQEDPVEPASGSGGRIAVVVGGVAVLGCGLLAVLAVLGLVAAWVLAG